MSSEFLILTVPLEWKPYLAVVKINRSLGSHPDDIEADGRYLDRIHHSSMLHCISSVRRRLFNNDMLLITAFR